ncbi:MAG: hypothetical protein LBG64_01950 [Pseudomonadales bacterium]|jgi:large subunit ribosomal protein L1|nr:hypothetical protein [Pseudomonadales bacterium]
MGSKKNVTIEGSSDIKVVADVTTEEVQETISKKVVKEKVDRRSKKYKSSRSLVDRTKQYSVADAIALAKKTSYGKFEATISADLVLKETDNKINVVFPHQTGKKLKVAIVDDELIKTIEDGKVDFDVLLTTPAFMPKLAKLARVLGPKGLMPNPKNETIVNDPEKRKVELESGKTILKTERKFPLLHVALGKASLTDEALAENFEAVIKACNNKVVRATISATMGPGVKVNLS